MGGEGRNRVQNLSMPNDGFAGRDANAPVDVRQLVPNRGPFSHSLSASQGQRNGAGRTCGGSCKKAASGVEEKIPPRSK